MDAMAVDLPDAGEMPSMFPRPPKEGYSLIPMWVADMNFKTLPAIQDAIIKRASHPCFGYFTPRTEYFDSIIRWQKDMHGVQGLAQEHIGYENGVLGGAVSAVQAFSSPGEAILLHSPTYIGFTHCLENNGRKIILSRLKKDENGIFRMDYEDMEMKIRRNHIHLAIFCSPHNPTGRVWTEEEIKKAMEIYRKNQVIVISDEIWSDLLLNGSRHIPTQSISEDAKMRTIALYAPSKTFNLAGLIGSYHIIYNPYLRDRVEKQSSLSGYNSMNVLSQHALIGAYGTDGEEWVGELCKVLSANINFACDFISRNFQGVKCTKPEGTYMLFLDCEDFCCKNKKSLDEVLAAGWDLGVAWQDGRPFHGQYSIRMNLALPEKYVCEAFRHLNFILGDGSEMQKSGCTQV